MRWEDLLEEKKKKLWVKCYVEKGIRRRPRDSEKEKVLILLDYARMRRFIEEGKFEVLGERRYRLTL